VFCLAWVTHADRITVHCSDEIAFDSIEKYLIAYQFRWNAGRLFRSLNRAVSKVIV
jgi:IS4 transposase